MHNQRIEIDKIIIKDSIQQRAQLNQACIEDYADEVANGVKFPPLVVYDDGENLLLADGWHRYEAYRLSEVEEVEITIYKGTVRDAILHAAGANANHGLRRTNADKLKAVLTLLIDPDWGQWSDTEVARRCNVTQPFVSNKRNELTQNGYKWGSKRKCADGRIMETSKIGVRTPTKKSIDTWANEENGSSQTEQETIGINENKEPQSSELNGVRSSPDSRSEVVVEMVPSDNDHEILVSDETDESNPTGNEDLPTEAESEQSSGQESSIDSNSTDSGRDEPVEQNDGESLPESDFNDATGADDESSDQNEEGNSGPDGNDVDGVDESTSTDNYEKEPNPNSSLEKQTVQEEDYEPEPDSNNSSSEESTGDVGDDTGSADAGLDESQLSSFNILQTDEVQALKTKIIEFENAIAEKDQCITDLELKNDELQKWIQELEVQLLASDGYLDSIQDIEPVEELSNPSIC